MSDGDGLVQVLEFELGDESYCVSIDHVTEIVDMGDLTPIPNSPAHIEGVIDLRGNTTSIVNPKNTLGIGGDIGERIIIFDSELYEDERAVGWAVDSIEEVSNIDESNIDDSPVEKNHIKGLIKREGEFVIWVSPKKV